MAATSSSLSSPHLASEPQMDPEAAEKLNNQIDDELKVTPHFFFIPSSSSNSEL
jgi:hypothetical protein